MTTIRQRIGGEIRRITFERSITRRQCPTRPTA